MQRNGNGALLQMRRDDYAQPPRGTCPACGNYSKAEWRCGIWLQQSDGVTLRGLTVIESGGDGIMILGGSLDRANPIPTLNTHIVDCVFDRNCKSNTPCCFEFSLHEIDTRLSRCVSNTSARQIAKG